MDHWESREDQPEMVARTVNSDSDSDDSVTLYPVPSQQHTQALALWALTQVSKADKGTINITVSNSFNDQSNHVQRPYRDDHRLIVNRPPWSVILGFFGIVMLSLFMSVLLEDRR